MGSKTDRESPGQEEGEKRETPGQGTTWGGWMGCCSDREDGLLFGKRP